VHRYLERQHDVADLVPPFHSVVLARVHHLCQ
jgi:hypothetical protein